jgi:uncharacterized membrane protein
MILIIFTIVIILILTIFIPYMSTMFSMSTTLSSMIIWGTNILCKGGRKRYLTPGFSRASSKESKRMLVVPERILGGF